MINTVVGFYCGLLTLRQIQEDLAAASFPAIFDSSGHNDGISITASNANLESVTTVLDILVAAVALR